METSERASSVWVAAIAFAVAACEEPTPPETQLAYRSTDVRNGDGELIEDSRRPGDLYVAYQQAPTYPIHISTEAFVQLRSRAGDVAPMEDSGGDAGSAWSNVPLENGHVEILGRSVCRRDSVVCRKDGCTIELTVPRDGYCVVDVSLKPTRGLGVSDCWGYGWKDGRDATRSSRDKERRGLRRAQERFCSRRYAPVERDAAVRD